MTDDKRLEKNNKIREKGKETRRRRASQSCFTYTVKIDESSLSKKQKEQLKMIFVEAKWLYNYILNYSENNDVKDFNTKIKTISIKIKDGEFVEKELKYISARMKQAVLAGILNNIKSLSALKKNGRKVGKLKYLSEYKSIDLPQYDKTYKILSNNKIRIQNINGKIKVNGLKQFINDPDIEIANAKLLNTPRGYYVAITCFKPKDKVDKKEYIGDEIGIDMGIKDAITLSNGLKFKSYVEETERLKKLQRKLSRQIKGSNNRRKTVKLIGREYQKITNRKKDQANKIVNYILSFEHIYMQDEMISNWHKGLFGKQVQHSVLGRIKAKLINHPRVEVLDRSAPTTKYCPNCGNINNDITLADRIYICPVCGYQEDRDIHSAKNMITMVKIIRDGVPRGPRKLEADTSFKTPVETVNFTVAEAGRPLPSICG